jgi:hypothetical protein
MLEYNSTDKELASAIEKKFKSARDASDSWRKEAEEDYNFVASHQWDEEDVSKLSEQNRPVITFNRCNVIVSAILGMEANQRQETKYIPRETSDGLISEGISEVSSWTRDYSEIEAEESMTFEDMLTCGMGWTETRIDYDEDLDGKLIQESVHPFEMYWDPTAKKRNLTDRRWNIRAKKMQLEEVKENWPDADIVISEDMISGEETEIKWINPADRYEDDGNSDTSKVSKGITVLQCQWYEATPVYRAADPESGKIVELSVEEFNEVKEVLDQGGARYIKQPKRKYYQAFVAGGNLLEKKECAAQDSGFTFKCVTGKRDHVYRQFYGIVRLMKDPQRWANKFFSQIIDIIDSNSKGGLLYEEGAFSDIRKAEEMWSSSDSMIPLKSGSIAAGRVMLKPTSPYPQGLDRLMQFAITSIYEITGVNLEMLGMADRAQPGVVESSRKKSGYTILASFFDSFRMYRKQSGLTLLEHIKKYIPIDRIQEVLSEELKPVAEQIKAIDLKGINVIVAESPQSDNNKEFVWQFIAQVVPALLQMGMPVPPEILEYSPLPATLTEKWKKLIEENKNNPQQQQQIEMAVKQAMADIKKTETEAQENIADVHLKEAKAQEAIAGAQQMTVETITGKNTFGEQ